MLSQASLICKIQQEWKDKVTDNANFLKVSSFQISMESFKLLGKGRLLLAQKTNTQLREPKRE